MERRGPLIYGQAFDAHPIAKIGTKEVLPSPAASTKLAFVVPIRGEITNHNFFLQLRSWNRQRLDPKQFEVLYVVNNSQQEAQARGPIFQENEKLVSAIRYIAGESPSLPQDLAAWETEAVENARQKGLQLRAVDLYSEGFTHDTDASEQARAIGLTIAKERFAQLGARGVIATVDADMRLGHETTAQILDAFADTGVGMVRFSYDWLFGEGGDKLFEKGEEDRFILAKNHLEQKLLRPFGGFYAIASDALEEQPLVGWLAETRDRLLPARGSLHAINTEVYSQHRARLGHGRFGEYVYKSIHKADGTSSDSEGFFNSWDSFLPYIDRVYNHFRRMYLFSPAEADELVQHIHDRLLFVMSKKFPGAYAQHKDAFKDALHQYLPEYSEQRDWTSINLQFMDVEQELIQGKERQLTPEAYTEEAVETVTLLLGESPAEVGVMHRYIAEEVHKESRRHGLTRAFLGRALQDLSAQGDVSAEHVQQYLMGKRGAVREAFFTDNPWIAEKITTAIHESGSPSEAYAQLAAEFPEYLQEFRNTTYKQHAAKLRGVTRFITHALDHPEQFPQANMMFGFWKHESDKTGRRR